MTNEIFSEILLQNGYAAENVRCIADLLSYGLVDKCFSWRFKGEINRCYLTIIWLQIKFFMPFATKKLLEQMTKHVSGI